MSDIILRSGVRARIEIRDLALRVKTALSEERGQGTIEYIGVLLVVAAVIAMVVGVVPGLSGTVENGAKSLINGVFSSHGGGSATGSGATGTT